MLTWFLLPHGGPDDLGAVDAVLVPLGLHGVEPLPRHVLQLALLRRHELQRPAPHTHTHTHHDTHTHTHRHTHTHTHTQTFKDTPFSRASVECERVKRERKGVIKKECCFVCRCEIGRV